MISKTNNPLFISIIVYIIILILLLIQKPTIIYDIKYKQYKKFGCRKRESLFAFPVLAIILAIIIYMTFALCFV